MKMNFKDIFRLPLEGKLSPKVTDEVENTINEKHLIRRTSSATFPSRGRLDEKGSRRGFTIVELAMALAIIVIVTAVSIGVVAVDSKTHGETIDMVEATNIAENAIECFRYAVNTSGNNNETKKTTFENCFAKSINLEYKNGDTPPFSISDPAEGVYTYTITDGRVNVTLRVNFEGNSITITATNDGTNDFLIEETTYTVR